MHPKISIIVPVYNVESYINKCVDSILAQTFRDFELILVDDGSTDNSGLICDQYKRKDTRIRVIHKENKGVSAARNSGIGIAKGVYIGFVDPDDTIEPEMYKTLFFAATQYDSDLVVCQMKTVNLIINNTFISSVWEEANVLIDKEEINKKIMPSVLTKGYFSLLSCCNKLYKKSCFDQLLLKFNEDMHHGEDARFNLILLMKIQGIIFIDQPLYNYYIHKRTSLTKTFRKDFYFYILDNYKFGVYLCKKYNLLEKIDDYINEFLINTLNFMQDVVRSEITLSKKIKIISEILNDHNFSDLIRKLESPSVFYFCLKKISLCKNEKLVISIIRIKNMFQNFFQKVV